MKDENEHTQQKLDALRLEHRDLDEVISRLANDVAVDEFQLQRMKKRKLYLKDQIALLENKLGAALNV